MSKHGAQQRRSPCRHCEPIGDNPRYSDRLHEGLPICVESVRKKSDDEKLA
jgi:hypothetical protein